MLVDCCANYLIRYSRHLYLDLDVESTQTLFRTLRRADGHEIGGEYAFLTAIDDNDWDGAEEEAYYHDKPVEYLLETWVLVKRQSRMLGPEPLDDEDDDDDDEPGRDQGPLPVPPGATPG